MKEGSEGRNGLQGLSPSRHPYTDLDVFMRSCAEEDVEGHVVTKTTRIVQKTTPEEGSFLALIRVFFLYTLSKF